MNFYRFFRIGLKKCAAGQHKWGKESIIPELGSIWYHVKCEKVCKRCGEVQTKELARA